MAYRFVAVVAALACINVVAAHLLGPVIEECAAAPVVEECPVPVEACPVPVEACTVPVEACPVPVVEACPVPVVEACPKPILPPCPKPVLPVIEPIVIKSVIPGPFTIGPQAPGVIEHHAAPYEINYFEKAWILKHGSSAAVNVFDHHPVIVDEYAAPTVSELEAPAAVVVEEVCGEVPAPCAAPTPCC